MNVVRHQILSTKTLGLAFDSSLFIPLTVTRLTRNVIIVTNPSPPLQTRHMNQIDNIEQTQTKLFICNSWIKYSSIAHIFKMESVRKGCPIYQCCTVEVDTVMWMWTKHKSDLCECKELALLYSNKKVLLSYQDKPGAIIIQVHTDLLWLNTDKLWLVHISFKISKSIYQTWLHCCYTWWRNGLQGKQA